MNAYDEFIMSYPTGKWKLEDVLKPDVIIQNVKTTEQISAESNKKAMNNEFVCDNINSSNEGFTNYKKFINYENFASCKNNSSNTDSILKTIIGLVILLLFVYIIIQIVKK
tara:strand:+ start:1263 stop:1595 length:333 start_codon:yes stop_codon:yes gene_type:complete